MSNLSDRVDDCFQSVSDGKELLADAITDKGVPASASEDFADLAGKVRMITTTGFDRLCTNSTLKSWYQY